MYTIFLKKIARRAPFFPKWAKKFQMGKYFPNGERFISPNEQIFFFLQKIFSKWANIFIFRMCKYFYFPKIFFWISGDKKTSLKKLLTDPGALTPKAGGSGGVAPRPIIIFSIFNIFLFSPKNIFQKIFSEKLVYFSLFFNIFHFWGQKTINFLFKNYFKTRKIQYFSLLSDIFSTSHSKNLFSLLYNIDIYN